MYVSVTADCLLALAMFGFCLISGYFTVDPTKKDRSVLQSFVHKFFRLYPSYLISLVVIFIVLQLVPDHLAVGLRKPFQNLAVNALLINLPLRVSFIDGAHWYVPFLLFFTLYFNLLTKAKRLITSKVYWLASYAAMVLIAVLAIEYRQGALPYLAYASFLCYGVFLRSANEKPFDRWLFVAVSCLELIVALLVSFALYPNQPLFYIVIVPFIAFVYLVLKEKISFIEQEGPITWLGDRSYNVYLIHQIIGFVTINFFLSVGWPYGLGVIAAIAVAICLGSCIYFIDATYISKAVRAIESRIWPESTP